MINMNEYMKETERDPERERERQSQRQTDRELWDKQMPHMTQWAPGEISYPRGWSRRGHDFSLIGRWLVS